ncbi:hypothetical protein MASR2M47_11040 [Draconibacterium sp.]
MSSLNFVILTLNFSVMNVHAQKYIPGAHQKLVMQRFEKVRKHPESLLDWDEAKKMLRTFSVQ